MNAIELRARREAAGFHSAAAFARALHIDPSVVNLWEKGSRPIARARLAEVEQLAPPVVPSRSRPWVPKVLRHRRCNDPGDSYLCTTCNAWSTEEVERLGELLGAMPVPDVIATLNTEYAEHRPPRTDASIRIMAAKRELCVEYLEGLTLEQLSAVVQWRGNRIRRHWIESGLLPARKVAGRGCNGRWLVHEADFEHFLREHVEAYDWRRFAPGPWRQKAEVFSRKSRWCTVDDLLTYLGVRWRNVWEKRWREIPHVRRHHVLGGSMHGLGRPMIDVEVLPDLKERLNLTSCNRVGRPLRKGYRHRTWRRRCRSCRARIVGLPQEPIPACCPFCHMALEKRGGLPDGDRLTIGGAP